MEPNNFINLYILTLITIFFLVYLIYVNKNGNLNKLVNKLAHPTEFKVTEFIIYDKSSTATKCDRLIEIKPFDWTLLNVRNQLFILNPERLINFSNNTLPTIRVFKDKFIDNCVQYTDDYIERVPIRIGKSYSL